jgi:squalene monooxygenase
MENSLYDVCIIGAGPAGAAMASFLGKNGVSVVVIEKNMSETDRIVGELLQPGGVMKLRELGLEKALTGYDAQEVNGYALFMNGEHFTIAYPQQSDEHVSGRGFHNGKFVQALRREMKTHASVEVIEGNAQDFIETADGTVQGVRFCKKGDDASRELRAKLIIVCDGIFSSFREQLTSGNKQVNGYFLGMVLQNCDLPFPQHGHVIITDGSPFLAYPISSNEVRVLIDFPADNPPRKGEELNDFLMNKILGYVPESMKPSFEAAVKEGKLKTMPNHHYAANPILKNGVVLVGDSLNMRHPLTGGGMTVAFSDVHMLGSKLLKREIFTSEETMQNVVAEFYSERHQQIGSINILADALYKVLSNDDLKNACFNYLKRGGNYASEPIAILSALTRDKDLLMQHFFSVAMHGAKDIMLPLPTPAKIRRSKNMISSAVKIITPLMQNECPGMFTKFALNLGEKVF